MPANTSSPQHSPPNDAGSKALERERASPEDVPVKQHNPGEQGLNPGQLGPAQPNSQS